MCIAHQVKFCYQYWHNCESLQHQSWLPLCVVLGPRNVEDRIYSHCTRHCTSLPIKSPTQHWRRQLSIAVPPLYKYLENVGYTVLDYQPENVGKHADIFGPEIENLVSHMLWPAEKPPLHSYLENIHSKFSQLQSAFWPAALLNTFLCNMRKGDTSKVSKADTPQNKPSSDQSPPTHWQYNI